MGKAEDNGVEITVMQTPVLEHVSRLGSLGRATRSPDDCDAAEGRVERIQHWDRVRRRICKEEITHTPCHPKNTPSISLPSPQRSLILREINFDNFISSTPFTSFFGFFDHGRGIQWSSFFQFESNPQSILARIHMSQSMIPLRRPCVTRPLL
jgi:hypothetical protein